MTPSWNRYAGNFEGTGHCLNTNKFGVLAEETTVEIPRVEQHDTGGRNASNRTRTLEKQKIIHTRRSICPQELPLSVVLVLVGCE